jgi:prolyl 4-hydroxylase
MLTFRAIEGSAVFWKNLDEKGRGDRRTLHAGLPVQNGTKIGLNIWTVV